MYKYLFYNRKIYIVVGQIYILMELRDRILKEKIGNVVEPEEGDFVDSMGKKHTTAMEMMRAELKYVLHRKF